ncbi:MAG TPA: DinB family protein [Vicinamibacterales bacterium]|nr:DinB family protein [Vicinamibacterales bacterium]
MSINDALLPEYDREMAQTRRLLERMPEGRLAWKPHDAARSLGELGAHIAELPRWAQVVFDTTVFDLDTAVLRTCRPASRSEILDVFNRHAADARATLAVRTDAEYLARWTLRKDGDNLFTLPKAAVIRMMVMNHLVHHRGQLTVYLRMLGVPLPPLYGPTADAT